jgi:hypothetical protein
MQSNSLNQSLLEGQKSGVSDAPDKDIELIVDLNAKKFVVSDQIKNSHKIVINDKDLEVVESHTKNEQLAKFLKMAKEDEDDTMDAKNFDLFQEFEKYDLSEDEEEKSLHISKGNVDEPLIVSPIQQSTSSASETMHAKELNDLGEQVHFQHVHKQTSNLMYGNGKLVVILAQKTIQLEATKDQVE